MAASLYAARTWRALELAAAGPITATEAARALDVDVRTARRLLARLTAEGVLIRRRGRGARYAPGPRLLALATDVILGPSRPVRPAPARAPG